VTPTCFKNFRKDMLNLSSFISHLRLVRKGYVLKQCALPARPRATPGQDPALRCREILLETIYVLNAADWHRPT
jgi:hypothetical protein